MEDSDFVQSGPPAIRDSEFDRLASVAAAAKAGITDASSKEFVLPKW